MYVYLLCCNTSGKSAVIRDFKGYKHINLQNPATERKAKPICKKLWICMLRCHRLQPLKQARGKQKVSGLCVWADGCVTAPAYLYTAAARSARSETCCILTSLWKLPCLVWLGVLKPSSEPAKNLIKPAICFWPDFYHLVIHGRRIFFVWGNHKDVYLHCLNLSVRRGAGLKILLSAVQSSKRTVTFGFLSLTLINLHL